MATKKNNSLVVPTTERQSVSVSVEKISNGYLIRKSCFDGKAYKDSTEYSKEKPKLDDPTKKGK